MILRLFKHELSLMQIENIKNKFELVRDDDKVLTIAGNFEELNPIMSGKIMSENLYKSTFSDYKDEDEKLQYTNELIATTRKTILNNLLLIASKGVWTEEARELYNYLNK